MEISERKKRIQVSCMISGILCILLFAVKSQVLVTEEYKGLTIHNYQAVPLLWYMILSALICVIVLWEGRVINPCINRLVALFSLLIMPFISFFVFEMTAENFFTVIHNKREIVLLNLCVWYALYFVVFAVCNHAKLTILFVNSFTYIFAVANAFVVQFREQPIMPMDLKSIWTAMSVAGDFHYEPTINMILMGLLMVLCNLWVWKVDFQLPGWKLRLTYCIVSAGWIYYCFYGMLAGDFFERADIPNLNFFRFNSTYQTDGYMACTMKSLRFLHVEEPEGYSVEKVKNVASGVRKKNKGANELPENIIVIMNESFADLSVLGDFQASEPVLPYLKEMESYTNQGNLYTSVYGGGTANSEFEFLTGNSVAYIPVGTVAFQMYVEEGDSSLVTLLKENGYRTVAYHPYRKDNYNRPSVYDIYGFDEYYGRGDIKFKKLREYASDQSDYQGLIHLYENKVPGEKLFLYNVTMQNHAGYDYEDYDSTIFLTDYPGEFPETEQYLSLMHESDQALQEFIEYFSQVEEKTVILLFGDHQPTLEDEFYQYVMGAETAENSFDHFQRKFITPYVLWSNYELDAEAKENISTNYLGSYLLDAIGVELPIYNRYLLELQEKIPAVNVNGFLDDQGRMHWIGDAGGEYEELLAGYHMFEYNNLFDGSGRLEEVYD